MDEATTSWRACIGDAKSDQSKSRAKLRQACRLTPPARLTQLTFNQCYVASSDMESVDSLPDELRLQPPLDRRHVPPGGLQGWQADIVLSPELPTLDANPCLPYPRATALDQKTQNHEEKYSRNNPNDGDVVHIDTPFSH